MTESHTELFVQLAQSAREAMPAAWAWCRVATKKELLVDLSQIVLDYAGVEDREFDTRSGDISVYARTTNGSLVHLPKGYAMVCHMHVVGTVLISYGVNPADSRTFDALVDDESFPDIPFNRATLSTVLAYVLRPTGDRFRLTQVVDVAVPTLRWSRATCPDATDVAFDPSSYREPSPRFAIATAPCFRSKPTVEGHPIDHVKLAAELKADAFGPGSVRTACASVRFTARPLYFKGLAPSRAQLRRQTPQAIDGLPGVWHHLLTATAERKLTLDDFRAPVKSLDLATGLVDKCERPCKRRRAE